MILDAGKREVGKARVGHWSCDSFGGGSSYCCKDSRSDGCHGGGGGGGRRGGVRAGKRSLVMVTRRGRNECIWQKSRRRRCSKVQCRFSRGIETTLGDEVENYGVAAGGR